MILALFALDDVAYTRYSLGPGKAAPNVVNAPFELKKGEPLRLRVFLDGLMLEVFAKGGPATVRRVDSWDMAAAKFVDKR